MPHRAKRLATFLIVVVADLSSRSSFAQNAPSEEASPPPDAPPTRAPYSLPFQLRPVTAGNRSSLRLVIRWLPERPGQERIRMGLGADGLLSNPGYGPRSGTGSRRQAHRSQRLSTGSSDGRLRLRQPARGRFLRGRPRVGPARKRVSRPRFPSGWAGATSPTRGRSMLARRAPWSARGWITRSSRSTT